MTKPQPKTRRTRGPAKLRRSEISRVAKGVADAGLSVRGFEVDPATGKFTILVGPTGVDAQAEAFDSFLRSKQNAREA
jgi:hypothetical protein